MHFEIRTILMGTVLAAGFTTGLHGQEIYYEASMGTSSYYCPVITCVPYCPPRTVVCCYEPSGWTSVVQKERRPDALGNSNPLVPPSTAPALQPWTDIVIDNKRDQDTVFCLTYRVDNNEHKSPCYWVRGKTASTVSVPGLVQYSLQNGQKQYEVRITATDPFTLKSKDLGYGFGNTADPTSKNGRLRLSVLLPPVQFD